MNMLKNLPLVSKIAPVYERGQLSSIIPLEYSGLPGDGDDNPLAGIAESMAVANSTFASYQTDDVAQTTAVIAGAGWLTIWLAVGGLGVVLLLALPTPLALVVTGGAGVWAYLREQQRMDAKDPNKLKLDHNLKLAQLRAWERQQQRHDAMRLIAQQNELHAQQLANQAPATVRLLQPQRPLLTAQPQPAPALLPAPQSTSNDFIDLEVKYDQHTFADRR